MRGSNPSSHMAMSQRISVDRAVSDAVWRRRDSNLLERPETCGIVERHLVRKVRQRDGRGHRSNVEPRRWQIKVVAAKDQHWRTGALETAVAVKRPLVAPVEHP